MSTKLKGIIRIAVDPIVEFQDRIKVSHLRDGGLLISSALAQLINNGVKIIPPNIGG